MIEVFKLLVGLGYLVDKDCSKARIFIFVIHGDQPEIDHSWIVNGVKKA